MAQNEIHMEFKNPYLHMVKREKKEAETNKKLIAIPEIGKNRLEK